MRENGRAPEPTELVYVPEPSWAPVLVAAGLTCVLVGIFAGWVWTVAGAVLGLLALRSWIKHVSDDTRRLPRKQGTSLASLPATPMRAARRS